MNIPPLTELHHYRDVALKLVEEAGIVLRKFWGNLSDIRDKDLPGDLVTEADKESERCILDILSRELPSHPILAEESGNHASGNSEFLWVIDPLDGTTNYTHQFPSLAISVALLYRGKPIVGVVFNPILNDLFLAVKGLGTVWNGNSIKVSKIDNLGHSLLASGFPYNRTQTKDNNYAEFCQLTSITQGVRRVGAASLDMAYVAAGRFDGYWERGIKPWDIAAGTLLIKEAGGQVSAYDETELDLYAGIILATNGLIHSELSRALKMW